MFKDRLRQLRIERNLTQAEIAKAMGVSAATIGNYEQGTREPRNNEMWKKLADYFGVSIDYLMDKEDVSKVSEELLHENMLLRMENISLKRKLELITGILEQELDETRISGLFK